MLAAAAPPVDIDQLVPDRASVVAAQAAPDARPDPAPPAQLGRQDGARAAPQLSRRESAAPRPRQLAPDGADATPPPALSRVSDGRQTETARVGGADRCDPARRDRPGPACDQVIERRAGDYARRPATELSPEQKLLADRELVAEKGGTDRLVRRIGRDAGTADEDDAQAIASIVLGTGAPPPDTGEREEDKPPSALDGPLGEFIGAITGGAGSTPPQ